MIKIDKKEYKLSLAMICKNETKLIDNCLKSVKGIFDEIVIGWTGTNPKTKKVLEKHKCKIYKYKWNNNFSDARNFSFSKATGDFIMWIDSDDVVINPKEIPKLCQAFGESQLGAIWLPYYYDFDKQGNCVSLFWRERIVRRDWFKWVGRLHENLIQKFDCQHNIADAVEIKHNTDWKDIQQKAERNLRIIAEAYKDEHLKNKIDPRTVYDFARSLHAFGQFQDAQRVFEELIKLTESDNDRYDAYNRLAEIARKFHNLERALDCNLLALKLRPTWPDAYLGLADTYYSKEEFDMCIHFLNFASQLKPPLGAIPCDPMKYEAKPFLLLQDCLYRLGRFKEALKVQKQAFKYYPDNKWLKLCHENTSGIIKQFEIENALLNVVQDLKDNKETGKLRHLVKAIPKQIQDHPVFVRLKNEFEKSNVKNRIVIFCGQTAEMWSPATTKKGIGGSEEAVINMANEFNKLGWVVDVYNTCDMEGNFDGVQYHNWWTFDKNVSCDVFIIWRLPEYVGFAPKDSYKVLWIHDVQKPEYYPPDRLKKIDIILPLSKWHRRNLPDIPDNKFCITRNGVNISQFENRDIKRDPYRCVYASSPDRGLDILLQLWPIIKKAVPRATLYVYYGFTKTYDVLAKDDSGRREYKEKILKLLHQPGIVYKGMVPHQELADDFLAAGLWLYPTLFTEISCITAMKAQIAGTIPVTDTMAALNETVQYGVKVDKPLDSKDGQDEWVKSVIDLLQNPEEQEKIRKEMIPWAKKQFSWENVAKDWDKLFKEGKIW